MADEMPSETWTVKEVVSDMKTDLVSHLDKQDLKLDDISLKIDNKADKADVAALAAKIDGHGERITTLEQHRLDDLASKRFRNRVWTVIGSVSGILAILAGSLIAAFVH